MGREARAAQRSRNPAQRICLECQADLTGAANGRKRCPECARAHHRRLGSQQQAERRAERAVNGPSAQAAEAKRRTTVYLRNHYAMSLEDYNAMAEAQGHRCAICRKSPIGRGKTNSLVVDHCHSRGGVRALLCGKCNIGIGLFDDDPAVVEKASRYLRQWGAQEPAAS